MNMSAQIRNERVNNEVTWLRSFVVDNKNCVQTSGRHQMPTDKHLDLQLRRMLVLEYQIAMDVLCPPSRLSYE